MERRRTSNGPNLRPPELRRIVESVRRVRKHTCVYAVFELFSLLFAPLLAETTFRAILDLHVLSRQEFYIFITQDGILRGRHVK